MVLAEAPSYVGALGTFGSYQAERGARPDGRRRTHPGGAGGDDHPAGRGGPADQVPVLGAHLPQPRGRDAGGRTAGRILDICRRSDLLLIEDNPYGLLGFDGEPQRALRADSAEGVVYLGTFSKTVAPGLRVGWALAPHGIRDKLVLAAESAVLCHSSLAQLMVREYLASQPWQQQVKLFCELYAERRDAMLDALRSSMPPGCRWTRPGGGFYVWLRLPGGLDAKAMLPRAISARVAYVPGTGFYADGSGARVPAAVLLLPGTGQDQGGSPPAGRRRRGRDGAARDVRDLAGRRHGMTTDHELGSRAAALGHVLVLAGGLSPEREVSLRSGDRVPDALREAGVDADAADADAALIPLLASDPPTAVFPAIHGYSGEDGAIREVLGLLGVPYVGPPPTRAGSPSTSRWPRRWWPRPGWPRRSRSRCPGRRSTTWARARCWNGSSPGWSCRCSSSRPAAARRSAPRRCAAPTSFPPP